MWKSCKSNKKTLEKKVSEHSKFFKKIAQNAPCFGFKTIIAKKEHFESRKVLKTP